jgi:CubicO group peptidase (beta-lactamase class C family)
VSIDFGEDYLATSGKFIDYRTATGWHPCAVDAIDQNLHDFLCTLGPGKGTHGDRFEYKSPNSDLLGWILERASGEGLASLFSRYLWQPMGAEANAYITVDRKGNPRAAGGLCVRPRDLLRFAELVRNRGQANGQQVIPATWIEDCSDGGSLETWRAGTSAKEFTAGSYRNKWYQTGDEHRSMLAIGIHSQWIYINPVTEVTIIKLSSQGEPLRPDLDSINLQSLSRISKAVNGA